MSNPELDLLLGRLAVHFQVLTKEQVSEALRSKRESGTMLDLGAFLVAEGFLTPESLAKLERARQQYLEKQGAAPAPAAPAPVAPAPVMPPASATRPVELAALRATPAPSPFQIEPIAEPGAAPAPAPAAPAPAARASAPAPVAPRPAQATMAQPTMTQPLAPGPPAQLWSPPADGVLKLSYHAGSTLDDLLAQAVRTGASDFHVHALAPLRIRIFGTLEDASNELITPERSRQLIYSILDDAQRAIFEERQQLDFAYTLPGVGRFRANAYRQQRGLDAVFRIIPDQPPTLEQLGLPASLERTIQFHQGMVLFTGPAGCGKSSTMAAMVRLINEGRPDHIITVEDPIEYVHPSAACLVNQRQVGPHTESFARALRGALREDPDVIVIGELRDLETISLALTAAETGHLVLGTLHTSSTIRTVNRLLGVFPPDQQAQIRTMVSESLRAVVSQRLLQRADGRGRVPALEVLMNNKAIGNMIRDSKTFQIGSALQTGASQGMVLLEASLLDLVKRGVVAPEEARQHAEDPKKFI
jgi:twitching motility protein PilT